MPAFLFCDMRLWLKAITVRRLLGRLRARRSQTHPARTSCRRYGRSDDRSDDRSDGRDDGRDGAWVHGASGAEEHALQPRACGRA